MEPRKITYYGGSELPDTVADKPEKVEPYKAEGVETGWDGNNSSPSEKKPKPSGKRTPRKSQSPARTTEQSSKLAQTDNSSADTTDGDPAINFDFN